MSHHVMSCHVISHHVMSCHVISHHITSCHVMSRHVTSCHAMSRHVTSCQSRHVTSWQAKSTYGSLLPSTFSEYIFVRLSADLFDPRRHSPVTALITTARLSAYSEKFSWVFLFVSYCFWLYKRFDRCCSVSRSGTRDSDISCRFLDSLAMRRRASR